MYDEVPFSSLQSAAEYIVTAFGGEEMTYKIAGVHGGAYYWGSINTHRYTIWRHARKMHGRCFAVNYRKAPQYPFPCAIQDCLAAYLYLVKPPLGAPHRPVDPKSIVLAGDSAGGGLCLALLQILRDTPGLELPAGAALLSPWSDLTHSFPSILQNTATKPSSLWPPPPPTLTHAVQSRLRSRVKEAAARIREHDQEAKSKKSHSEGIKGDKLYSVVSRISTRSHGKVNQRHDNPEGDSGVESSNVVHASAPSEAKTSDSPTSSPSTLHPTASSPTDPNAHPTPREGPPNPTFANPASLFRTLVPPSPNETKPTTLAQCTTPLSLKVKDEKVVLDTQIQIYATNAQLCHPWVSPVLGYLGGLPPLYIMCGDKEVLRDEIIYLAHKAANPSDHSLRPDVVALLPSLEEIESRYGPTNVHLQVYDGVCHDLPLFSMTTAARGCFRAIASFARYVTPSTPGSLYIGRNPSVAEESDVSTPATPNTFITPIASVDAEQRDKILGAPMASSPVQATPHPSQVSLRPNGVTSPPLRRKEPLSSEIPSLSELRIQNLDRSLEGTAGLERANGKINEMKEQKKKEVGILPPRRGTSLRESFTPSGSGLQNTSMTPITSATGDEVLGDDTGPRFAFGTSDQKKENGGKGVEFEKREEQAKEGEEGYSGLNDSRAKKGEAGWPGIYRGDNPFTDHMIRERVSNIGVTRPLTPPPQLQALTMPPEEIGKIKEGPAMRYINGQKLWDKKYRRTAERVKKRREKNLLQAHKAGEKVGKRLEGVVRESMRAEKAKKRKERIKKKVKGKKLDEEDEDESETESSVKDGPTTVGTSMTWTWALKGEAPPPSAIVSRRDFVSD
ncbi:esterase/lipase [Cryptococcus gattii NT-10]|nr:esterase/lipase [Cryptococcus gattii NT-10]